MLTSEIHAKFGINGLFQGLEGFELQSIKAEFTSMLKADAREFKTLVNSFFQSPKFSYKGNSPTSKEYQEQHNRLHIYNRLLKLYLKTNITMEVAFIKAMAFLETKGVSLPRLQGRLTNLYKQLRDFVTKEVMEEQIVELEASIQEGKQVEEGKKEEEKDSFKVWLIKNTILLALKMGYRCHKLIMWLKNPRKFVIRVPSFLIHSSKKPS